MSRSGNVWDNAAMKSFSSSLTNKRIGRRTYRMRHHANSAYAILRARGMKLGKRDFMGIPRIKR